MAPIGSKPRKPRAKKPTTTKGRRGFMKRKPPAFVLMNLNIKHTRNGVVYGPGRGIQVPRELERGFLYEEQYDKKVEDQFQSSRGMIIGPRGSVRQVPVEAFESADVLNLPPITTVKG